MDSASSISSKDPPSFGLLLKSFPRITALSAKFIFALNKSSPSKGDPLMYRIFGNRLIYSQISVGFSGAKITIY